MICDANVLEAIEDRPVLEQRAVMEAGGPRMTERAYERAIWGYAG